MTKLLMHRFAPPPHRQAGLTPLQTAKTAELKLALLGKGANPNVADFASLRVLLTITEPGPTHNVDWIGFGPDGYLYMAKGDGGNNTGGVFAQDIESLLGKILRLDPCDDDFPADPDRNYAIPADNPFVGVAGRDAESRTITLGDHLSHLVIHGYLHLLGHDHMEDTEARQMEDMERRALATLGIADPYLPQS